MDTFTPIPFVYYELIEEAREAAKTGKIHYFSEGTNIECEEGEARGIEGEYLILNTNARIRLDKIITIFGKPGPAYDLYDSYANACMDCMGGMD